MTKIKDDVKIKATALIDAGFTAKKIFDQLGIKYQTVKSFIAKYRRNKDLQPKVKVYKGYFKGRIPSRIKN